MQNSYADNVANRILPFILVVLTALAFTSSFAGAFVFDDDHTIVRSVDLEHGNLKPILAPRGFVYLTLLFNRSLGRLDTWHYHAVNLLVHVLAGLVLYSILRRTLRGPAAPTLAFAIAAIWSVHPIQTQSVTYIIQRTESIAGLFYLLTLFCAIQSADSAKSTAWQWTSVACCALGMASKELVMTAPLTVLIYDRLFLSGSFRDALKRRRRLYAGLLCTVGLLALLIARSGGGYSGDTIGTAVAGVTPLTYMLTQLEVIVHYIRISFVPASLCFDYQWRLVENLADVWPQMLAVAGLTVFTIAAVVRGLRIGFIGVWFLVILAPTSSFFPIADRCVEHRLYLPLAAAAAVFVLTLHSLAAWVGRRTTHGTLARICSIAIVSLVIAAAGAGTFMRSILYSSKQLLWTDVVEKRPDSWRAHYNLANSLAGQRQLVQAIFEFKETLRLKPDTLKAHSHLGISLILTGAPEAGVEHCLKAIALAGDDEEQRLLDHVRAAFGFMAMDKNDAAMEYLEKSLTLAKALGNDSALVEIHTMINAIDNEKRGESE